MLKIKDLLDGFDRFYKKYFLESPETYKNLHNEGQSPRILVISCSDSRVDPSIIFDTKPGDIFVVRNVANLVPPFEKDTTTCHGTSAAIEYAIKCLKIKIIIVLGHSNCGGIETLIKSKMDNDYVFIDDWLNILKSVKNKNFDSKLDHKKFCELCEKEAILVSIKNLKEFPFIREKLDKKELSLNGWYFDLEKGILDNVFSSEKV